MCDTAGAWFVGVKTKLRLGARGRYANFGRAERFGWA
jgi:hypothetical protein